MVWYDPVMRYERGRYAVHLGDRGRLVLPAAVRRQLHLQPGDRLVVSVADDGTLNLVRAGDLARRLKGVLARQGPERSLVDELLAERREEARREEGGSAT
jgi:AbrB family looped-hinge helix DNA binding protein